MFLIIGIVSTLTCVNATQIDNYTDESQLTTYDEINSLKDAVFNANNNDTIYLANITYDGDNNTQITVNKSINFIGSQNTVIDGKNQKYLFIIADNVKVSFKNIIFRNAYKSGNGDDVYGAALEIFNADVIIDNCQFISNKVSYGTSDDVYGAAISNKGNLSILNSYFLENTLDSMYEHNGFGGSIYNNGNLYINNASFIKSRGGEYSKGSAIYNDGNALINNSIIADSHCLEESMGSAIFNNGDLTLANSIIENNIIERNNFNYIYGNIYNSGLLVAHGNIFKNNTGYYKQPNSGYDGSPTIYNAGDLNMSYNAFIDNIGGFKKIYRDIYLNGGKSVNIDNNWWGSNDNPFSTQSINVDKVDSRLILNITPYYSSLRINDDVDIIASWKLSNGLNPQFLLPFEITFSDEFGNVQKNNLKNQYSIFNFNSTQNKGLYVVNVVLNSYKQSVMVDVGKIKTNIEFNHNNNIYPNEKLCVNVSLSDENSIMVNENITVSIYNQSKTINLINGKGSAVFTNLIPNYYNLKIEYGGSDDYFKSFAQSNVSVIKYPVDLTIEKIKDIHVDETFNISVKLGSEDLEGIANLYINGLFKQVIYLKNGVNLIEFSNFDEGAYNITIEIVGNEYYQKTNVSSILRVYKYDSLFNLTAGDIFINNNQTLLITTSNDFIGEVILSINGANSTLFLNNVTTKIVLTNLSDGIYDVNLIFKGNAKFNPQNASTSFEVRKFPSKLTVSIEDNIITVKTSPANCTGVVNVYVNNNQYQSNITDGEVIFNVEFDEGTNYIHVLYNGDNYYALSDYNTTVGNGDAIAIIGVNATSYEYQLFNFTVQVFEKNGFAIPYTNILVKIDSIEYNVSTNSQGIGILPLNLKEGNYDVTSTYKNLTTTNHIIIQPIEFNLTANNIIFGENAVIIVEFNKNIVGNVNFTFSNGLTMIEKISEGKAICSIENMGIGLWNVKTFYTNDLFNSTSKNTTFEVEKLFSTINLEINEAFAGQVETIIAKTDNLTGNITFSIDGQYYNVNIINNQAKLSLSNLEGGLHTLEINYAGDNYHKNITFSQQFSIKTHKTRIVLDINDTAYGEEIIVTAKLDSNASGNIAFSVNNLCGLSKIKNATAKWSFGGLNVGSYTIKAEYSGDDTFISCTNSTTFNVLKTNSVIELYVDNVYLDENIRIHARLSPNATGKVSFRMQDYYSPRDKNVINSTVNWYISPLEKGQYTIYATYRGDSNYYESSTKYVLNISQTRSILIVDVNDVTSNDTVILNIALISKDNVNINGVVNVQLGEKSYKINVHNGEGLFYLGKLNSGEYVINASYDGDDKFSKSAATTSFTVYDYLLDSFISCNDVVKYYNNDVKFVIFLSNSKNKAISGETVYVKIKDVVNNYTTDDYGKVYLDINNIYEKYDVDVEFRGSSTYYPSKANATIEVLPTVESNDVLKAYGSGVQYFALFKDFNGKALSNTNVTFSIAGKMYNYTTFPNGVVKLNINLKPGKYSITAVNTCTGENITNTLNIFKVLIENSDVINYFGAKSNYHVKVYGNDGKPVGEGVSVTFKVDAKTYNIKTDKNGYATLSVKLNAKQYIVTAEYNGTVVYNKITVKPVLTLKITTNKKTKKTKFKAKLVNTKGKALKGKKIVFKINGKKYTAKTNKKGFASINIKLTLKKGTYKIYAIYKKSKIVNKIKIN